LIAAIGAVAAALVIDLDGEFADIQKAGTNRPKPKPTLPRQMAKNYDFRNTFRQFGTWWPRSQSGRVC
jgi:hypothetical protein